MSTVHFPMERIEANPFRDIETYHIDETVVSDLQNSIRKSKIEGKFHGMWENFGLRIKPGTLPAQYGDVYEWIDDMQELSADEQVAFILENDIWGQQDSGHHRKVAADREGIKVLNLHVRDWTDDHMLVVMALENQESFRARPFVALETIEQVVRRMESHLEECETWEEFEAKGYATFKSRRAFSNARTQGVGIKSIKAYLGEGWSDMYVRHAKNAISDVRAGLYEREMLKTFPTVDAIGGFHTLAKVIVEQEVPTRIVQHILTEAAKIVSDQAITGKTLDTAAKQFKTNGNDPLVFLSKTILTKLNWKKFLKALELADPENCMASDMVAGGSETWTKLADTVKEEIEKDVEKQEAEEKLNREVTERAEAEGISEDDARALIEKERADEAGEGDSGTVPGSDDAPDDVDLDSAGMPDVDGLGLDDGSTTVAPETTASGMAMLLGSSLLNLGPQFTGLRGKVGDLDKESDKDKVFFESLESTFESIVMLMAEHVGYKEIRSRVTAISKK